jgi:hypothetical protein
LQQKEEFGAEAVKCFPTERTRILELEQLSILQQEEEIRAELLELFANEKKKNF